VAVLVAAEPVTAVPPEENDPPPAGYAERFIDRPLVLPPRLVQARLWGPGLLYSEWRGLKHFTYSMEHGVTVGLLDRWEAALFAGAHTGTLGYELIVNPAVGVQVVRSSRVQAVLAVRVPITLRFRSAAPLVIDTRAGVSAGLDTRLRLRDGLALRAGEDLLSVFPPPSAGPWWVGFRLAPALEVQLGDRVAVQARVLLAELIVAPGATWILVATFGVLPRLVFSLGWRCDLILDVGVTASTLGALFVNGALGALWRF